MNLSTATNPTEDHWTNLSPVSMSGGVDWILEWKKLSVEKITNNQSSLSVYPARGGIVTSLVLNGVELLYQGMLDETLHDISKNVKWGIPIMFPNAWPLSKEVKETSWLTLPQHGFARTNTWTLWKIANNQIKQSLHSQDIRDLWNFPFEWSLDNTITLESPESCSFEYTVTNNSEKALPFAFWLHPYFDIPQWKKDEIEWLFQWGDKIKNEIGNWSNDGTTYLDIPEDKIIKFKIPWVGTIRMELSLDFKRLWVWSLPGKNFVCVEPVFWDEDTLITNPVIVAKWEKYTSFMKVSLI